MSMRFYSLIVVTAAAAVLVGCDTERSKPVGPSTVDTAQSAVAAAPAQPAAASAAQHTVTMFDACDPETFNAALGDGACTRSGGVRFADFLALLAKHQSIGGWHFAPPNVTMRVGQMLIATNRGGETHTFTEVDEFGGGIVDELNQITGLTSVAPECTHLAASDFIAPGGSSSEREDEAGVEKYQCCIHPWMRAQVRITEK